MKVLKNSVYRSYFHVKVLLFFAWIPSISFAQHSNIQGKVYDQFGYALPGVHVQLNPLGKFTVSDGDGAFKFTELSSDTYQLKFTYIGFNDTTISIKIPDESNKPLRVVLTQNVATLNEITVQGKSESREIKESIASVSVVNVEKFYSRASENVAILNTIPGVQVKQSGGVGNSSEVSIQGLSGRQIKFFMDGIPLEFMFPVQELGIGASLAMLPVSSLERFEVYKGTVPIQLGADALGGGINIIMRKDVDEFLDISIQKGSFETTQATLNLQKQLTNKLYTGLSAYYSTSANNYVVNDVTVVNQFGNPEQISAKKFHDQYSSHYINAKIGSKGLHWADHLELNLSQGSLYDEIQHNFEMRQPYGKALNKAKVYNTNIRFNKTQILDKVDVDIYAGYNVLNTSFVDTTQSIYDWNGNVVGEKNYGGEITTSQNNLRLQGRNITGKFTTNYHINDTHQIISNWISSAFQRSGSDPIAAQYYGEDFFKEEEQLFKTVFGIGYEGSFWDESFSHHTLVKFYNYHAEGFEIIDGEAERIRKDAFHIGFGESLKWNISNRFLTKLSYEYATRIPDRIEVLGDFSSAIASNPNLVPETSHNVNLGMLITAPNMSIEASGFFKEVDNIIILRAVPPPVMSSYQNLLKARVLGIDTEIQLQPTRWLSLKLNGTYQDLRNRSSKENAGVSSDRYFGVRLPNKPYLFGGAELNLSFENILLQADELQAWWSTNYVHEYYRYWEIDGRKQDKLTVPHQNLHDLGLTYNNAGKVYTVTFQLKNIFNTDAFDHFRVQKPGRSWQLQFRFFIKNFNN